MNWYYADKQQQIGPVSEADFQRLVSTGTITPQTLVWNESMPAWKPYAQISGQSTTTPPIPSTPGSIPESIPPSISTIAKPPIADPMAWAESIIARGFNINMGHCISRSWALYQSDFGPILGASTLVMLVLMAAGGVPYIGPFIQIALQGALMGGLYLYFLNKIRGNAPSVGDAFNGFQGENFKGLMLCHVVQSLLILVFCLPMFIIFAAGLIIGIAMHEQIDPSLYPILIGAGILLFLLFIPVMIYLTISWIFAIPLVADRKMDFWQAMKVSRRVTGTHFWPILLLTFVGGIIAASGFILCCVGMFLTIPIYIGALMYAYEDIFKDQ